MPVGRQRLRGEKGASGCPYLPSVSRTFLLPGTAHVTPAPIDSGGECAVNISNVPLGFSRAKAWCLFFPHQIRSPGMDHEERESQEGV